jgi:ABC-2 type transport system ATP-binding protein
VTVAIGCDGLPVNAIARPALEARSLTKHYRAHRPAALDGVDLVVATGSVVALVGPNGAGKSTLIRCFLGFEQPTRGTALVHGSDARRDRVAALGHIGYVGQRPGLYGGLTVAEHLDMASTYRPGFDLAGATTRITGLGLDPTAKANELSGGEQAQVALTIAIATGADVLLLDEPLAALDPLARRGLLALLRSVSRDTTILFASHIVGDLASVCDRLIVLAAGRVAYDASIAVAQIGHALQAPDAAAGADIVGIFDDRHGRPQALIRTQGPGVAEGDGPRVDQPGAVELDDIVLGYLAGARDAAASRAIA